MTKNVYDNLLKNISVSLKWLFGDDIVANLAALSHVFAPTKHQSDQILALTSKRWISNLATLSHPKHHYSPILTQNTPFNLDFRPFFGAKVLTYQAKVPVFSIWHSIKKSANSSLLALS